MWDEALNVADRIPTDLDHFYTQLGRWTMTFTALFRGALAVVIDVRNRRLIRVAKHLRDLRLMSPNGFEHLCKTLFLNQGYRVRHVGGQSDGGVDILVSRDGIRSIVQCKQYSRSPIARPALQQLYGAFEDNDATAGFVVTASYFSKPAKEFAKGKPITLIDGRTLVLWINRYAGGQIEEQIPTTDNPRTEQQHLVCPDCGNEFVPPFKPRGFAPVYCWDCCKKRRRIA